MAEWSKVYPFTLGPSVEGGYQCMYGDRGNWSSGEVGVGDLIGTNGGISAPILIEIKGKNVTPGDMKNLTKPEIISIAKQKFFDPIKGDLLPPGVDLMIFDMEYNAGREGVKGFQKILGIQQDGLMKDTTLQAMNAFTSFSTLISALSYDVKIVLQKKISAPADGDFGPISLAALYKQTSYKYLVFCAALHDTYLNYYERCAEYPTYGRAWATRNKARLDAAYSLL